MATDTELGFVEGAKDAASRALADYQSAAMNALLTRLAYASALAKAGELEEACSLATAAIKCREVPALPVVVRAREFDALLKPNTPAVLQWRETLASVRTPT